MLYKNKEKYVAQGIITFAKALCNEHHADLTTVLTHLQHECKVLINIHESSHPERNK
mgnify:CR=1 FL=1|tara:strand:- start:3125 stop:3295 length:171 start_codon:yes stop_codon:yes gene_type:complete